jgi:hypothetical protein
LTAFMQVVSVDAEAEEGEARHASPRLSVPTLA